MVADFGGIRDEVWRFLYPTSIPASVSIKRPNRLAHAILSLVVNTAGCLPAFWNAMPADVQNSFMYGWSRQFMRLWWMLMAGVSVAMIPVQSCGAETNINPFSTDPVVVIINHEEVGAEEYRMVMMRKTAQVFNYFKRVHDLDDHLGYWSESTGPEGPLAKLREMTLEELVRIKTYQALARQKGVVSKTSFFEFKADFEKENNRRAEAKKAGAVIYGPVQYRLPTYYYICFGDLSYKLRQKVAKECAPNITGEAIEVFFEDNPNSFEGKSLKEVRDRIVEALSLKAADKILDSLRASAVTEVKTDLLKAIVPREYPVADQR